MYAKRSGKQKQTAKPKVKMSVTRFSTKLTRDLARFSIQTDYLIIPRWRLYPELDSADVIPSRSRSSTRDLKVEENKTNPF